jgi:hypothetical protein
VGQARRSLDIIDGCGRKARLMPVSFQEIVDAFEFVSFNGGGQNHAYLCRQSGKIYWHAEFSDFDLEDELPNDIEDSDKYLAIPDKRELDLGKPLVLDFAAHFLSDDFDDVRQIFNKRGAYGNFKSLLARRNLLDQWYEFDRKATERALREWCELNGVELAD